MQAVILLLSVLSFAHCKITSWSANYIHANSDYDIQLLCDNPKDSTATVEVNMKIKHEKAVILENAVITLTCNTPHTETVKINPIEGAADGASLTLVYSYKENGKDVLLTGTVIYILSSSAILIQTDKPIYKPGETVKFRGFMVNRDLKPIEDSCDVYVINPNKTRIMKWEDIKTTEDYHIFENEFRVSDIPILGEWTIRVECKNTNEINHKTFKVDKYVLPKFEVTVKMDKSYVTKADQQITGHVQCMYTFGKPCFGDVAVEMAYSMQDYGVVISETNSYDVTIVHEVKGKLDEDGKFPFEFTTSLLSKKSPDFYNAGSDTKRGLEVKADVTEYGTEIVQSGSSNVAFADSDFSIKFSENNPDNYKPGMDFDLVLEVSLPDGVALSTIDNYKNLKVDICAKKVGGKCFYNSQETIDGTRVSTSFKADIKVDESENTQYYDQSIRMEIVASITYKGVKTSATKAFDQFSTTSHKYCSIGVPVEEGDEMKIPISVSEKDTVIVFQLVARSKIVSLGKVQISGTEGTLTLTTDPSWSPIANLVVSTVVGDEPELVACARKLTIKDPFKNKVTVAFDKSIVEPGENVTLTVTSSSSKFVAGILSVDESVTLLAGADNDIDVKQVMAAINSMSTKQEKKEVHSCFWCGSIGINGKTSGEVYDNAELLVITNCELQRDYPMIISRRFPDVVMPRFMSSSYSLTSFTPKKLESKPLPSKSRTRSFFPESWIFSLIKSESSTKVTLPLVAPDTITKWVASAFVLSNEIGLGVALKKAELITRKKCFVRLNLPYSVKRGEQFLLSVSVFNYLDEEIQMTVTLSVDSKDFDRVEFADSSLPSTMATSASVNVVLSKDSTTTMYFPLASKRIGKLKLNINAESSQKSCSDAVIQPIRVVPEGIQRQYTIPFLVNRAEGSDAYTKNFNLTEALPKQFVPDSDFCKISLSGDVMGNTMNNLDGMIQKPFGCGEQTMIILAPMVYTVNYLKNTNQLETNTEIKQKAFNYMQDGYQRELTFQHSDNSFSAFGDSDNHGSTWLTAFVVKVFSQLSELLYIDAKVVEGAIIWLKTQMKDGRFVENGNVCHREMQGDTVNMLTPFVVIAINTVPESLIEKFSDTGKSALQDIKNAVVTPLQNSKSNSTYAMVLKAIALQGLGVDISTTLTELEKRAIEVNKDGEILRYWQHKPPEKKDDCDYFCHQSPPANVELTAYALLLHLADGKSVNDLVPVQKWLVSQQNHLGGYSSTQNTIIALQALSEFIESQVQTDMIVKIQHKGAAIDSSHTVKNSPLVFITEFHNIKGNLSMTFTGKGRVSVAITVFYNDLEGTNSNRFNIDVSEEDSNPNSHTFKFCLRDTQADVDPLGMVVYEIAPLSGLSFDPDNAVLNFDSIRLLKKVESFENNLALYFDTLLTSDTCVIIEFPRGSDVAAVKPAVMTLSDYYNPDIQTRQLYTSSNLEDSTLAEVNPVAFGNSLPLSGAFAISLNFILVLSYFVL